MSDLKDPATWYCRDYNTTFLQAAIKKIDNNSVDIFGFIWHYLFAQFESNDDGIFEQVSM